MSIFSSKSFLRFFLFVLCTSLSIYFYIINNFPNWAFLLYAFSSSIFFYSFLPSWHRIKTKVSQHRKDLIISLVLLSLTILFYCFKLNEVTPGMWGDEVGLGWMAEQLRQLNQFTPFISYNLGHPTPLIYLSIIPISWFGRSIFALRIVSIIFGGLSVSAFYFLLRRFFDRILSVSGAIILASSYILIIVSRLAYEMSAAIFVTILSAYALALFSKKVSLSRAVFLGFILGAGSYTYLSFRLLLIPFLLVSFILIWKQKIHRFKLLIVMIMSLVIVSLPLATYSLRNHHEVNERVYSLSVFHQGLSYEEISKELRGAASRTLTMFFTTGDPNLRQNPADTTPIDPLTTVLFFGGMIYLLYKKRAIGAFLLSVIIIVLLGEIITLEQIPEAHYYGLGHPNTLRISIIIPAIIFSVSWALHFILSKIGELPSLVANPVHKEVKILVLETIVLIICLVNINRYFSQKPSIWIHKTNYVIALDIIDTLNLQKPKSVMLSQTLYRTEHFRYFLDSNILTIELPSPIDCDSSKLTGDLYIFWPNDIKVCEDEQLSKFLENSDYNTTFMTNEWSGVDVVVMERKF